MRKSRDETAATRERIVELASVMVRERGIEGLGIADVMRDAGLTHGGFYRHFKSKEALVAAAFARAFAESKQGFRRRAAADAAHGLDSVVSAYLSERHRNDPGHGCIVAALGSEARRQGGQVGAAFARGAHGLIDRMAPYMRGPGDAERRDQARAVAATMVGALTLARTVEDPAEARAILAAARHSILTEHCSSRMRCQGSSSAIEP